jgi:transforming growth factor-beta-induced protein
MKATFFCALSSVLLLFTTPDARSQSATGTIVDIAAGNPDFSTLVTAAPAAGLVETLSGPGPFTVFAPNNAAFAKLPAGTVEALLQDANRLRQILLYHVVPGRILSTDLTAGKAVTAQGAAVTIDLTAGVKVNDSTVIAADIEASNGIIHVIDTVLLPPPNIVEIAAGNPDFSTLVTAVQAAGLVDALTAMGPYTVFAPNDAAFAKLPAGTVEALLQDTNRLRQILLYHLIRDRARSTDLSSGKIITLQGSAANLSLTNGVKVNDSAVIAADIEASNGIIHVIDTVLLPPPNIVEIAAGNPDFSTLVTAVQAAGLVDALTARGPYTVFAPNNAAFAKLPAGTVEALLQDTNRLRHILLYHVNHGPRLRSSDLQSGAISSMHGGLARVTVSSGVKINQANVIAADLEAGNGIIHVIDEVILPDGGIESQTVSVTAKGNQLTIIWPFINGQTQVLETTTSLAAPSWNPLTAPVTTSDGINKVTLSGEVVNQFFRIRSTSP